MTSSLSTRFIAAAALAVAGLAASSAAQARDNISFSIGINSPPVYSYPAPVYVQPRPVYVQPRPIYIQPQPVYVQPQYGYVYDNGRYWRRAQWERRHGRHGHGGWDHGHDHGRGNWRGDRN